MLIVSTTTRITSRCAGGAQSGWIVGKPSFPGFMALADARAELRQHADAGCECPVCGQLVKVYRRTLTTVPARVVMVLIFFLLGSVCG